MTDQDSIHRIKDVKIENLKGGEYIEKWKGLRRENGS